MLESLHVWQVNGAARAVQRAHQYLRMPTCSCAQARLYLHSMPDLPVPAQHAYLCLAQWLRLLLLMRPQYGGGSPIAHTACDTL